jgi:predicted nucleic acid-binding protein
MSTLLGRFPPPCRKIWHVLSSADTTPAEIASAFRIEDESRIGFWDALIVSSASKNGATRILSEDFNAGQRIAGILIENPFVGTDGGV